MYPPAVEYDKEELDRTVDDIEKQFPDDIDSIRYSLGDDWSHDPALFFRVLLKDRPGETLNVLAAPRSQAIFVLCSRIMAVIRAAVIPFRMQPYIKFRWVSEQTRLRDPAWE